MSVPALRVEEPTFREGIEHYVTTKCRRLNVPPFDIEDLAQEAMTHIIAKLSTFQPEKSEFEQWARGIALNVIREYVRKAKLYFALFTHANVYDYAAQEPSPERCARRNQALCAIEGAAQGISLKQAQVFVLHTVHDMSHKDIGQKLRITESISQKDYQRARDHLALCLSDKAFSVMPPSLTSCNEPVSFNKNGSRWTERSHYAGQIVATIIALLPFVPACIEPQMRASVTEEARVLGHVQNVVMYRYDKLNDVHDEPAVHRDAPRVKLEPASLTSVRAVSTPTRPVDKRTPPRDLAPLPPYKHTPDALDHLLPDRRFPAKSLTLPKNTSIMET